MPDLLDQGWRRSGCYLYKPESKTTCCPAYTIRLRAEDFSASKEQLRVLKRMQSYLDGIWDGKKDLAVQSGNSHGHLDVGKNEVKTKEEELMDYLSRQIDNAIQSLVKSKDLQCDIPYPQGIVKKVPQIKKQRLGESSEDLLDTSNISFQIASVLRRAKSDNKSILLPGRNEETMVNDGSSYDFFARNISDKLAKALRDLVEAPELSIKACNGHLNFYSTVKDVHFDDETHLIPVSRESSAQVSKVISDTP
ncbi:unnamed protein product [Amaranthus hypochondriacus]